MQILYMNQPDIIKYYSQNFVQKAIAGVAESRELISSREDGGYIKRPDIVSYPQDIVERAKLGAATFHCSVEKWKNPMQLGSQLSKNEMDELRICWDLIIDIDAKVKLEHSQAAAIVVCDYLKDLGINPSVKFSGRRGFHIGISSEAFPEKINFKETSKQYPEIPQIIANFIREKIKDKLLEKLIDTEGGVAALSKTVPDLSELSPYEFIDIEKNWGSRHLFRAPYSLHHKTWLVSLPIRLYQLKNFKLDNAKPERVKTSIEFLENKKDEATELILQALDWKAKLEPEVIEVKEIRKRGEITAEIPKEYFPPCIKNLLKGISDGRKRSVFTLAAFLGSVNWKIEKIEEELLEWNKKNPSPLPERLIKTQLKWHARRGSLLPANCESDLFYKSIGVCKPDGFCPGLKNPVNYAFKKFLKIKYREEREKKVKRKKRNH